MIRVEAVWMAVAPVDMRSGMDSLMARVVEVFGAVHPHHAYCFTNRRANRVKVLVHDGLGLWLSMRRLHQGRFAWAAMSEERELLLSRTQFDALVLGLPWQRLGEAAVITLV